MPEPEDDVIYEDFETEPDDLGDAAKIIPFDPSEVQDNG